MQDAVACCCCCSAAVADAAAGADATDQLVDVLLLLPLHMLHLLLLLLLLLEAGGQLTIGGSSILCDQDGLPRQSQAFTIQGPSAQAVEANTARPPPPMVAIGSFRLRGGESDSCRLRLRGGESDSCRLKWHCAAYDHGSNIDGSSGP